MQGAITALIKKIEDEYLNREQKSYPTEMSLSSAANESGIKFEVRQLKTLLGQLAVEFKN